VITVLLGGLLAGALHVVSGPDHLAALVPLAAGDPRQGAVLGARWGFGHGLGVVLVGALALLARGRIDLAGVGGWAEVSVGVLILAMGFWTVRRAWGLTVHAHPHGHGADDHQHLHVHVGPSHQHASPRHAALGFGLVHGVAGTGHLLGVVPSLLLPVLSSAIWLLAYLGGAVVSMLLVGALVGRVGQRVGARGARRLLLGSGVMAIVVGAGWSVLALG
jgi:ABC-type nickel/cobalt efflux system permease component RcnA